MGEKDPKDIAVHRIAGITALVINLDSSLHGQPSVHSSASSPRYLRESPQAAVPIQSIVAEDRPHSTASSTAQNYLPCSRLAVEQACGSLGSLALQQQTEISLT